jgi:stearoyl-CoA desaturase (delta-9 desaturase)
MLENVAVELPGKGARGADTTAADLTPLSPRHLAFVLPLVLLHLACCLVLLTGFSMPALAVFLGTSALQIFGITAGYHRLLAHRSYKTSRGFQFVLALLGVLAGQNGPLWWVSHHRHHHRHSDHEGDPHSPRHGFFWSHVGWLFSPSCVRIRFHVVADLTRCFELVQLERYCYAINIIYALLLYGLGEAWRSDHATSSASGFQFLVWGGIISTVFAHHALWSANSICHRFGFRRYTTSDDSRNNFVVSLLTFGDGWHHNHHRYPNSARHGFRWWEIDINFAILSLLSRLGVVWDLRLPQDDALQRSTVSPSVQEVHGETRREPPYQPGG